MVDKLMKLLVELVLGKRARTGPLRICIADRSTIITILSSGAGRAFIRNESSDEEPFEVLDNNAFRRMKASVFATTRNKKSKIQPKEK